MNRNTNVVPFSQRVGFALFSMVCSAAALAQGTGIDVSSATADVTASKASLVALAAAALGILIGIKLWKMARRAL